MDDTKNPPRPPMILATYPWNGKRSDPAWFIRFGGEYVADYCSEPPSALEVDREASDAEALDMYDRDLAEERARPAR